MVTLKVASRCNLACSYCYVYAKGDETWRRRPPIMSDETFSATVRWIRRQTSVPVTLLFHGGEPTLVGAERFDRWCREASDVLAAQGVSLAIQTNGLLIDDAWIDVLRRHQVSVGVSLDGPPQVHDAQRFDHRGAGSYEKTLAALRRMTAQGVAWSILSVINFDHDPVGIHRHLVDEVGADSIDYLLPDETHETVGTLRERYGPTPVADWLIPLFDEWWQRDLIRIRVRVLDSMIVALKRQSAWTGQFGNAPLGYLIVESDGTVEGLDVLKMIRPDMADTGLTVWSPQPIGIALPELHRKASLEGFPLPTGCHDCREADTCAGGWLPHRYARESAFDNPSAWCTDLYRLFDHVRDRLGTAVPLAYAADRP
ncbi:radical SAM protein [Streptomyces sp. NPDC002870]|uniref:radical SAM protein n=1 Tax=Streptomyces sp. NPDC002870 TaxID=3364666 RepID=UPI0036C61DEF